MAGKEKRADYVPPTLRNRKSAVEPAISVRTARGKTDYFSYPLPFQIPAHSSFVRWTSTRAPSAEQTSLDQFTHEDNFITIL
jgi:hypothetical protein